MEQKPRCQRQQGKNNIHYVEWHQSLTLTLEKGIILLLEIRNRLRTYTMVKQLEVGPNFTSGLLISRFFFFKLQGRQEKPHLCYTPCDFTPISSHSLHHPAFQYIYTVEYASLNQRFSLSRAFKSCCRCKMKAVVSP